MKYLFLLKQKKVPIQTKNIDTNIRKEYNNLRIKFKDKFERAGFHTTKSEFVNAPLIDELPMTLECKVKSFANGILVGEIVNVSVDKRILNNGQIDPQKLKPITYDPVNQTYIGLGKKVGSAFKDGLKLKL